MMNLGLFNRVIGFVLLFIGRRAKRATLVWPSRFLSPASPAARFTDCNAFWGGRPLLESPISSPTLWRELACRVAPRLIVNVEEYLERRGLLASRWTSHDKVDCDKKFEVGEPVSIINPQPARRARRSWSMNSSNRNQGSSSGSNFIGIDISAKTVDVAHRQNGRVMACFKAEQTGAGHAALSARLLALKPRPERVVLEATGVYYLDLAVALTEAGLAVSVINPKSFHHFAKLKLAHVKTDRADAQLLAEYAERIEPALWSPPDRTSFALRDLGRQINRLTRDSVRAKNRLHALASTRLSLPLLIKDETAAVATLGKRIERLTRAALRLIAGSPTLATQLDHLDCAVGVGQASAISILAELCVLPTTMKANQVARYAGLDVRLAQSGTSVNQPARLSKAGNAYLRGALFMPAMSAAVHDPIVKAFYQSVQSRGKKKIQAICAVMRKYLTGLWACLQNNQPFDSAKLFSHIHLKIA